MTSGQAACVTLKATSPTIHHHTDLHHVYADQHRHESPAFRLEGVEAGASTCGGWGQRKGSGWVRSRGYRDRITKRARARCPLTWSGILPSRVLSFMLAS